MTPRSLWTIIIKISGISLLLSSLTLFPEVVSSAILSARSFSMDTSTVGIITGLIVIASLSLYLFAIWVCLYKTDYIIDHLSLDKHFQEEKFEINIHPSTIIKISIIIVGALLFVESLPEFCRQVIDFYQQKSIFKESPTLEWLVFHLVKALIGYLLMTNSRQLTNWLMIKSKNY